MQDGRRYAGAAVTAKEEVIRAELMPTGTSAKQAELIALTKALELERGWTVNVYTDSRYAFATTHVYGPICKERGLLTMEGKHIKSKDEILDLLKALWLPKKLAIIHCSGYQRGIEPIPRGNNRAVKTTWQVALQTNVVSAHVLVERGP